MTLYLKDSDSVLRWIHKIAAHIQPADIKESQHVHGFLKKTWSCKTKQDVLDLGLKYCDIQVLNEEVT